MSYKFWEAVINDYEKLLETGERSDVIIYAGVNENEFRVHSDILCIRSQYFRAAFSEKWAEKKDGMLILKKPNIEPNTFHVILRFIYSGNVDLTKLQGSEVLKLLIAVDELNFQPLISCIQEYLTNNKSELLQQDPMGILEIVYQHEKFTDLWNFCLDKICDEPKALIDSDKFINLKAPLLELLLKRDNFALDEIDIWDSLIKWGLAQNPTIPKDVKNWSKEQMTSLERILHRFIPLIRFHHIPSDDFFYKVLPYKKLLPKQLFYDSLEFTMAPDKKKSSVKMQPPRQLNLVHDSIIIETKHFALFSSWIDRKDDLYYDSKNIPYGFNLLYRASRDGLTEFHNKCDNKGATIVIAKMKETDQIFGGYNPIVWDTSGAHKATSDSFIFSFANQKDMGTAKIGRVNNANHATAIYCERRYGPVFCGGIYYEISKSTWYHSPSYYSSIGLPSNFIADDYEVFQVMRR